MVLALTNRRFQEFDLMLTKLICPLLGQWQVHNVCVYRLFDLLALTNKTFQKSFNVHPKSVALCVMLIASCTGLSDRMLLKLQQKSLSQPGSQPGKQQKPQKIVKG